jgi:hypothetical protein
VLAMLNLMWSERRGIWNRGRIAQHATHVCFEGVAYGARRFRCDPNPTVPATADIQPMRLMKVQAAT